MGYGVIVRAWGNYACFTRPEFKVERVSYDMMTPTAAKGLIEAIYWKPAIKWQIDEIHVINPIKFTNVRRNEVSEKMSLSKVNTAIKSSTHYSIVSTDHRHQRAAMILTNVEYIIKAHFELVPDKCGPEDTVNKHYNIALRRLQKGQSFSQPFFGTREFGANFEIIESESDIPKSQLVGEKDLGYMLYSLNYQVNEKDKQIVTPSFFRAVLNDGVLKLADSMEVFT